ncbi:MAG: hypothetical protein Satyrvirus39_2 [Satyrvirus sp.]|uniref:Uncharacterized protein n=1 Tax=Satyrvirus sp. TaxID=2487771 RepID=A0A3G5AGQ1_9VIRU|nr:MAG: hypothetical protein Satyrvirus39_2 [Satyrvirus sp.]
MYNEFGGCEGVGDCGMSAVLKYNLYTYNRRQKQKMPWRLDGSTFCKNYD